jgi:N-acetylglucosamine-6-sulfatase
MSRDTPHLTSTRAVPRAVLALLMTLAVAAPALLVSGSTQAAGRDQAPNIVVIQSDDQTFAQLNREVMPNTERLLVSKGTTFTNYIATTAQCCPSRASLFTGQYAHNHGVTSNQVGYPGLVDKGNVLPVWLDRAGYSTIHVGKFMNGYNRFAEPDATVAPGWDEWHTVLSDTLYYGYDYFINGRVVHMGRAPQDNLTTVLNRDAVRMVKRYAPKRRPFYLQLDERSPHVSHQFDPHGACGHAATPEPRDERRFKDVPLPKPPSFNEKDMSDKPPFLRTAPLIDQAQRNNLRRRWRCALDALAGVDRGVAKVYDAVKQAGEIQRTVFVFVSDNGYFYGEHRLAAGKVFPYEEALHLPLVMRVPRRYRDGASRVLHSAKPAGNIDLAPTILQLAGASPCVPDVGCRTMDGRSLMPVLERTGSWPRHRGLLTEYRVPHRPRNSTCQFAGVRTRHHIYTEHYRVADATTGDCIDATPPEVERYDLKSDPFELRNVCPGGAMASCPAGSKQLELQTQLARLKSCAGVRDRDERVGGRPYCE